MKKIFTILFVLTSLVSFGQKNTVLRASAANVVEDQNLRAGQNFYIPRYADTTAANVLLLSTQDTVGALIFTYDVNNFWIRVGNPHHWQQGSGGGVTLPDGVYSGGQVAYSGVGYDYIVSAATFVLGGVIYNSPQTTVTLLPADPTFNRIDVIGLSFSVANGIAAVATGTASANPQEPSVNPQTFIRRSIVTVVANTLTPPYIDQTIIFDEGLGEPTEWTPSSTGATIFTDPTAPYHLVVDALTSAINSTQRIKFINDDTVQSASRSSLVLFIDFQTELSAANNINIQLLFQGNPVSPLLPVTKYGVIKNIPLAYQMAAIPFSEFSTANIIFDEVDVVPTGAAAFPIFYLDYIQIQTGLAPIVQIPNQKFAHPTGDNFANEVRAFNQNSLPFNFYNGKVGFNTSVAPLHTITVGDEGSGFPTVFLYAGDGTSANLLTSSSSTLSIQSGLAMRIIPNAGNGGVMVDVGLAGANESLYTSFYNTGNSEYGRIGIRRVGLTENELLLNAPTVSEIQNYITIGDSLRLTAANAELPDSVITQTGGIITKTKLANFQTTYFNSNLGSFYRWAVPNTNGIKGARGINGVLIDSATSANTLTFQVDSTIYGTKAWVMSVAGGGGTTGVTSVSAVNTNGVSFSIPNPTTTPAITLSTTVTSGQVMYANSGAFSGSANYTWDNTNQRLNIGGGSAVSYLGLHAGTTTQAPANVAPGVAPTSPVNGDIWTTSTDMFVRLNGATIQITNPAAAGVTSITGTAGQVIASAATGAVTLSLPQSILATSTPTFRSLTLGGTAATTPLTFTTNTDATASAGRWYYNTTRLGFSLAATILRVPLTNDVAPTAGQSIFGNGTTYTVGTYSALNNSLLVAPSAAGVTFRANSIVQTLSGTSVTMNINNGENANWTLSAVGSSLAITNPVAGRLYFVNLTQDATGNRTITTYPAGTVWYSGSAPVLKTGAGNVNTLAFWYNGSNYYGFDWGSGGGSGFTNPMTSVGDLIRGGVAGAATRLAGNITTTPMILTQVGTGAAANAPAWQPTFTGLTASTTLDFPNTLAQSSSEMTIAVTGAVLGDVVQVGTNVNNTNSDWSARVASAGFVAIRFNNYSAAAQNPASGTFKVIVWQ